jgi:hypothetical protein
MKLPVVIARHVSFKDPFRNGIAEARLTPATATIASAGRAKTH